MSTGNEQPKKNKSQSQKKNVVLPKKTTSKKIEKIVNEPTLEQKQIADVIEQALSRFYVTSKNKQNKIIELQHLDSIISEYLQSFMVLGYDINGEKICITHAATPAARDSLLEHLRSTFINIMNGNEG